MGIFNRIAPVYTSSVLVELFNTSGQFSVKVWYRNSTAPDAEPFQMIIPGNALSTSGCGNCCVHE